MKLAARTLLALLLSTSAALADDEIDLDVRAPDFDGDVVRSELSAELGSPISKPTSASRAKLAVAREGARFRLTLAQPDRAASRDVDLPKNPKLARETLVLLLAAMLRDEAGPLLDELQRRKSKPSVEEEPAREQPPPAPPKREEPPALPKREEPPPSKREETPVVVERSPCDEPSTRVPIALDFAPFVGVSTATQAQDARTFSVGAIGATAKNVRGVELSGVVGVDRCSVRGAQIAGVVGVNGATTGAQIAGIVGRTGSVAGVQIGGVASVSGEVRGLQVAGVVNVADTQDGVQIGLVNVAHTARGLQVGLVNVAEKSDAPIGLFNFIKEGRHHVDAWSHETGMTLIGAQLGGKYTHAVLGVGARPGPDGARFVYGGGLGVHLPVLAQLGVDLDLLHYDLAGAERSPRLVQHSQARLVVAWQPLPRFAIFGGPTFNLLVSNDRRDDDPSPYGSWQLNEPSSSVSVRAWPGFTLGVRTL